jgi:hypothetical protein
VIGAIEVQPGTSRLGFPFDPLQLLGGRPLLARTVEAVLACPAVEELLVLAAAGEAARLEAALRSALAPEVRGKARGGREPLRGGRAEGGRRWSVIACHGDDIPGRGRLRRLRRLAPGSWRAGWAIPFALAEGGNPRWLLQALDRRPADRLIAFPPAAPFLDPLLIAGQIGEAERRPSLAACLSTAPPGVAGDILARQLLEETARAGVSADAPLRFLPDHPERALENKGVFHWFPAEVSGFPARLTAESRRGLAVLAGIDGLGEGAEEGAPAPGRLLSRLRGRPDVLAGPVPAEIWMWITGKTRTPSVLDPPPDAGTVAAGGCPDMDPLLFSRIAREVGAWQECRLVIAGGEPLLHPRIGEILTAARESGAGVVQVETDGRGLDGEALDLLAGHADLVSVAVDAVRPATYRALKGVDALEEVERGVSALIDRASRQDGRPAVAVVFRLFEENREEAEEFFDRWFPRTPFVVVEGAGDRAGQLPARAIHPARTPERIPCLRLPESLAVLPDGRAVACRNDFRGLSPVGDLRSGTVEEVWRGPALSALRAAHARLEWQAHPLCGACSDWCRR